MRTPTMQRKTQTVVKQQQSPAKTRQSMNINKQTTTTSRHLPPRVSSQHSAQTEAQKRAWLLRKEYDPMKAASLNKQPATNVSSRLFPTHTTNHKMPVMNTRSCTFHMGDDVTHVDKVDNESKRDAVIFGD
jgi:hypothetical protein